MVIGYLQVEVEVDFACLYTSDNVHEERGIGVGRQEKAAWLNDMKGSAHSDRAQLFIVPVPDPALTALSLDCEAGFLGSQFLKLPRPLPLPCCCTFILSPAPSGDCPQDDEEETES